MIYNEIVHTFTELQHCTFHSHFTILDLTPSSTLNGSTSFESVMSSHMVSWQQAVVLHNVIISIHRLGLCIGSLKSQQVIVNLPRYHNFQAGDLNLWPITLAFENIWNIVWLHLGPTPNVPSICPLVQKQSPEYSLLNWTNNFIFSFRWILFGFIYKTVQENNAHNFLKNGPILTL